MNGIPTKVKLCVLGSAVLAGLGALVRTVCMLLFFDANVGYFQAGPVPVVCTLLSFAAVLWPAFFCISTPKGSLSTTWRDVGNNGMAILPGSMLLFFGIYHIATFPKEKNILVLVTGLLALGAALYFYLTLSAKIREEKRVLLGTIGLFTLFWGIFCLLEMYVDMNTAMNSPVKTLLQFGLLSMLLVMVAELRFRLDKPHPRMALFTHCTALYFCLTAGISTFAAAAQGSLRDDRHLMYALVLIAMGVYTLFRLITHLPTIKAQEIPPEESSSVEDASAEGITADTDTQAHTEEESVLSEESAPAPTIDTTPDHTEGGDL